VPKIVVAARVPSMAMVLVGIEGLLLVMIYARPRRHVGYRDQLRSWTLHIVKFPNARGSLLCPGARFAKIALSRGGQG